MTGGLVYQKIGDMLLLTLEVVIVLVDFEDETYSVNYWFIY